MSEKPQKYNGPAGPVPAYGNAPDLTKVQVKATKPPARDEDFEVVHVFPPVDGVPRLGQK